MATAKTETTELAVGFGLLGYSDPSNLLFDQIAKNFDASLDERTFSRFRIEFSKDKLYKRMHEVGLKLRDVYAPFKDLTNIIWSGPERQAATTSTAKDLFAANVPISVKAESRVVGNPSPYNLFVATPQGSAQARGMGSWYVETALNDYQSLYFFAKQATALDSGDVSLPEVVGEFENSRAKKLLQQRIKDLNSEQIREFQALYVQMCKVVSIKSAVLFNSHLKTSLFSRTRNTVMEHIAKMFFRMNAVPYLLAGIDSRKEFAVHIPDLTTWKRTWRFEKVEAVPDLNRLQSVVNFQIECLNRENGERFTANFHAEVRWSHGKFSSVEGKLYKKFNWVDLPFFERIIA